MHWPLGGSVLLNTAGRALGKSDGAVSKVTAGIAQAACGVRSRLVSGATVGHPVYTG